MKILEARGISKEFPGVRALDDITFSVDEGEVVGLVGENGAGKSTLMKIISGFYPHNRYRGELFVKGERVFFNGPRDAENAGLEMIYQEINMHLDLTVAENIFLGKWPKTTFGVVDWKRASRESVEYLKMLGADFGPDEVMRDLNAGRQQQVAFARALYRNPSLLILDEPTSVLTEKESAALFSLLEYLNTEKGLTILLISHKLEEVFANTGRIVTLRDGRTVGEHKTAEATKDVIVSEMVGRQITSFYFKEKVEPGETVLTVENLSVPHPYTKGKHYVTDISFALRAGEILGIAGLMGSGRSELVNAIFGKGSRLSGSVALSGEPIKASDRQGAIRAGLGLVPEDRKKDGFVGVRDIKENITMASLKRFSAAGVLNLRREAAAAEKLFSQLRVKAPGMAIRLGQLSGGNQQKVVMAKWLMAGSKVLILDDPTRGVDVGAKEDMYHLIGECVKKRIGIILISSELSELLALSDRVLVLRNGRISAELAGAELSAERVMGCAT